MALKRSRKARKVKKSVKSRKAYGGFIHHKSKPYGTSQTHTSHGSIPPRMSKGGRKSRKSRKSRKLRKK